MSQRLSFGTQLRTIAYSAGVVAFLALVLSSHRDEPFHVGAIRIIAGVLLTIAFSFFADTFLAPRCIAILYRSEIEAQRAQIAGIGEFHHAAASFDKTATSVDDPIFPYAIDDDVRVDGVESTARGTPNHARAQTPLMPSQETHVASPTQDKGIDPEAIFSTTGTIEDILASLPDTANPASVQPSRSFARVTRSPFGQRADREEIIDAVEQLYGQPYTALFPQACNAANGSSPEDLEAMGEYYVWELKRREERALRGTGEVLPPLVLRTDILPPYGTYFDHQQQLPKYWLTVLHRAAASQ